MSAYDCTPIGEPRAGAKPDGAVIRDGEAEHQTAPSDEPEPEVGSAKPRMPTAGGGGSSGDSGDADKRAGPEGSTAGTKQVAGAGGSSASGAAGGGGARGPTSVVPERSREPVPAQETAIAAETADAAALVQLADWSALPLFAADRSRQASSQDRGRGVETESVVFRPIIANGERDFNNFVCKSADADLATAAVPYLYDEMARCPETYVHGVVLARFEGSGRMVRLALTAGDLTSNSIMLMDEMLRIYVDDNPRAIVQARLEQIVTGAAGEIFATPFGSIATNSLAWYYPVVFSRKLVVALDYLRSDFYVEVDAALDATQQPRVAAPSRLTERDAAHARLAGATPLPAAASMLHAESVALAAGGRSMLELAGPATVEELRLRVPKDKLASLNTVHIAARWDGATQPAIDVPILAMFAAVRGPVAGSSLALASTVDGNDQVLSLRLPMPFRTTAVWTLSNAGPEAAAFALEWIGEAKLPGDDFGHLNLQYNEAPLPPAQIAQLVAQANARGRFVGLCADLDGHSEASVVGDAYGDPLNLVGGDVNVTSDGQVSLASVTTDSYVDNAYYFLDSPKSTPFAQNWNRVDNASAQPPGQISFCRWHVLGNEVDFQHDLKVTRNAARRDLSTVDLHRTVAYLYLP